MIDLLRVIYVGSGTGMGTGSEAGIGSGIVLFLVFLETLIRGERSAVCRPVLILYFVRECYSYYF